MTHPPLDFGPVLPELILVGAGLALLLVEAIFKRLNHAWLAAGAFAGIFAAGAASVWLWNWSPRAFQQDSAVLGGMVAADRFSGSATTTSSERARTGASSTDWSCCARAA